MGIVLFVDFQNKALLSVERELVYLPPAPTHLNTEPDLDEELGDGCFML